MIDYICSISENIRRVREERDMTQDELAELADISLSHLSKVESGSRTIGMKTYVKILDALDAVPILVLETGRVEKQAELLLRFIYLLKECSEAEAEFLMNSVETMKDNIDKIRNLDRIKKHKRVKKMDYKGSIEYI